MKSGRAACHAAFAVFCKSCTFLFPSVAAKRLFAAAQVSSSQYRFASASTAFTAYCGFRKYFACAFFCLSMRAVVCYHGFTVRRADLRIRGPPDCLLDAEVRMGAS